MIQLEIKDNMKWISKPAALMGSIYYSIAMSAVSLAVFNYNNCNTNYDHAVLYDLNESFPIYYDVKNIVQKFITMTVWRSLKLR